MTVGDAVSWTNCDSATHNVTWKQPGVPNRTVAQGESAAVTFTRAGFYDYYCSIHGSPSSTNMQGRVIVEGVPAPTTKPTAPPATTTTAPNAATTSTTDTPPTTTDLGGIFGATTTAVPLDTTTTPTTVADEPPIASKDKRASAPVVVLLVLSIAGVVGSGFYAVRRMRQD